MSWADFVQQIGEIFIIDAGDLGVIIQIRTRGGGVGTSAVASATVRKKRRAPISHSNGNENYNTLFPRPLVRRPLHIRGCSAIG